MKRSIARLKADLAAQIGPSEEERRAIDAKRNRGRSADAPTRIPLGGWKDIIVRSYREIDDNNLFLIAGGVTYALVLALFPALAALVALYGLLLDPIQVEQQVNALSTVLPATSLQLISAELRSLVQSSGQSLGIGAMVALVFALWTASRGMSGLISAFNIAYRQPETRGFIRFNLTAIGLTIAGLIVGVVTIALVGVLPAVIQFIGLGAFVTRLILIVQWPILLGMVLASLAALYRYAPNRTPAKWRWVSPGAMVATILWLIGSMGFSVYVAHFNSYSATYGSFAGMVILLTWLYLSSFVALLGAVINAQTERQARPDSTGNQNERAP